VFLGSKTSANSAYSTGTEVGGLADEMALTWASAEGANCEMSMTQYKMILSLFGLMDLVGRMAGRLCLLGGGEGGGDGEEGMAEENLAGAKFGGDDL
jgi:hypothetical protein